MKSNELIVKLSVDIEETQIQSVVDYLKSENELLNIQVKTKTLFEPIIISFGLAIAAGVTVNGITALLSRIFNKAKEKTEEAKGEEKKKDRPKEIRSPTLVMQWDIFNRTISKEGDIRERVEEFKIYYDRS